MTDEQAKLCANPACAVVFARPPKMAPSRWATKKFHDADCGRLARRAAAAPKRPVIPAAPVVASPLTWRPSSPGWVLRPGDAGYQEQAS